MPYRRTAHFHALGRPLGGNLVALFACERSGVTVQEGVLPCVHALGLRQLLLLYSAGIHYLLLSKGDCRTCDRCAGGRLDSRLDRLAMALTERHQVPVIDTQACDGCDACIRLCPTDALSLRTGENEEPGCYHLEPAACTGCGICISTCEQKAVSVHSWKVPVNDRIALVQNTCKACGNRFHLPDENPHAGEELCPICRQTDHSSRLFQVLND